MWWHPNMSNSSINVCRVADSAHCPSSIFSFNNHYGMMAVPLVRPFFCLQSRYFVWPAFSPPKPILMHRQQLKTRARRPAQSVIKDDQWWTQWCPKRKRSNTYPTYFSQMWWRIIAIASYLHIEYSCCVIYIII